jgi:predicted DNA-binding protein with PD1-like motif
MKYKKAANSYVIRLDGGERIVESLEKFCAKEKISGAHFSGIGTLREAELAYYDVGGKKYRSCVFNKPPLEIVSLLGNASLAEGKIKIHAHVVISDSQFRTFGGHLNEGSAYPMCEIVVTPLGAKLERKKDEKTGLMVLDF